MAVPFLSSVSPKTAALTFAGLLGGTVLILAINGMVFNTQQIKLHSLLLPVETVAPTPEDEMGDIEGDLLAQEDHSKSLEEANTSHGEQTAHVEHTATAVTEANETTEEAAHQAEEPSTTPSHKSQPIDSIEIPTYETTPYGDIPAVIGAEDEGSAVRPLDAYALESLPLGTNTRGVFAIVLMDFGLSSDLAKQALESLPPYITVAVSPYAPHPDKVASQAYAKKFEAWGDIPLEPTSRNDDTGALALRDGVALEENQRNLYTMLAHAGHVPGLIADGRGKTSESGDARLLLIEAKERGYGLVLMGKQERAEAVIERLDPLAPKSELVQRFVSQALNQTQGTLFVSLTPAHIKALPKVIETLEAAGLQLVPLSRLQDPLL